MNWFERAVKSVSPGWAVSRMRNHAQAEFLARHYEAASRTYRTKTWARKSGDADAVSRMAIHELRIHSRDLVRNNGWAWNAAEVISSNIVGEGIMPASKDKSAMDLWREWADTTACDATERLTFAGIQELIVRSLFESGEVLVRRRRRRIEDGLPIPLALEVLEPDYLDTSRNGIEGNSGGFVKEGIEYDAIGRRSAYWLFDEHPGSQVRTGHSSSQRVAATEILHIFRVLRPGQTRGVSWLAQAILTLKDLDKYEDASLLKQQIAAMFAAFVTDLNGMPDPIGLKDPNASANESPVSETIAPGGVAYLPVGKEVTFSNPPNITPDGFDTRALRKIAAGIGLTYEDLTGDYSLVNYSSARMGRTKHYKTVSKLQNNLLIPQLCAPVWAWAMEAAVQAGTLKVLPKRAKWTPPAMPMIEPDKEGLAIGRLVRNGLMTQSEAIRQQGYDPDEFLEEVKADNKKLDGLGIVWDSDPRKVTQAGLTQQVNGGGSPTERALVVALERWAAAEKTGS